jgi:hypothetical protein
MTFVSAIKCQNRNLNIIQMPSTTCAPGIYCLLLFALLLFQDLATAARSIPELDKSDLPCARMSKVEVQTGTANLTVPYCKKFHSGPVAIKFPADTSRIKFGAIAGLGSTLAFVDRTGTQLSFPGSLLPSFPMMSHSANQSMSQMVFKAVLVSSIIVKVDLVLLVDQVCQCVTKR